MSWPWTFQDLTPEQRQARRLVLDRYGRYSALLAAAPVLAVLAVRVAALAAALVRRAARGRASSSSSSSASSASYDAVPDSPPDSPSLKSRRRTARGAWAARWRRVRWWLADDVAVRGWACGQRDQWLVGGLWTAVLLALCVAQTGDDYLHLTKRLGIVAIAQLPLQYALVQRGFRPFQRLWGVGGGGASHDRLNRWHRALGAVVYALLLLHALLYLNYFARLGGFAARLRRPVVVLGLAALAAMTLLTTTALAPVRRWSYRVFFVAHVAVACALPPLVLLHARHAAPYVVAALLVLLADFTLRRITTVTAPARLTRLPGTQLVRLTAALPPAPSVRAAFARYPGRHVYLSLPPAARPAAASAWPAWLTPSWLRFELLFNPFTVAAVDPQSGTLTLVVHARAGPLTRALAQHARLAKEGTAEEEEEEDDDEDTPAIRPDDDTAAAASIPVNLEGPYGASPYFPALTPANFDRVLLVAGGVGATFAVPLYRAVLAGGAAAAAGRDSGGSGGSLKVDFVWSVRGAAEAAWAVAAAEPTAGAAAGAASLLQDRNVHIFVTGGHAAEGAAAADTAEAAAIELTALQRSAAAADTITTTTTTTTTSRFLAPGQTNRRRPDLRQIVDDVLRQGSEDRVAVLVCGPAGMVRDLRAAVAPWVQRGRSVWWHNESFSW